MFAYTTIDPTFEIANAANDYLLKVLQINPKKQNEKWLRSKKKGASTEVNAPNLYLERVKRLLFAVGSKRCDLEAVGAHFGTRSFSQHHDVVISFKFEFFLSCSDPC